MEAAAQNETMPRAGFVYHPDSEVNSPKVVLRGSGFLNVRNIHTI